VNGHDQLGVLMRKLRASGIHPSRREVGMCLVHNGSLPIEILVGLNSRGDVLKRWFNRSRRIVNRKRRHLNQRLRHLGRRKSVDDLLRPDSNLEPILGLSDRQLKTMIRSLRRRGFI